MNRDIGKQGTSGRRMRCQAAWYTWRARRWERVALRRRWSAPLQPEAIRLAGLLGVSRKLGYQPDGIGRKAQWGSWCCTSGGHCQMSVTALAVHALPVHGSP